MTTAGNAIVQGTGVMYVAPCGTEDPRINVGGEEYHNIALAPAAPWVLLGKLGKGGLGFSAGFQPQLIEEANSLWAIDARVVQGGGGLSLSLLESSFNNVFSIGVGEAGAKYGDGTVAHPVLPGQGDGTLAEGDVSEMLVFDRHAGPDKSVPGVALLHDGFGASIVDGERVRRRMWVPRAINTSPFSVAISDNAPQVIVGQFAFALSDYALDEIYGDPATVADGGQPPMIWMEAATTLGAASKRTAKARTTKTTKTKEATA